MNCWSLGWPFWVFLVWQPPKDRGRVSRILLMFISHVSIFLEVTMLYLFMSFLVVFVCWVSKLGARQPGKSLAFGSTGGLRHLPTCKCWRLKMYTTSLSHGANLGKLWWTITFGIQYFQTHHVSCVIHSHSVIEDSVCDSIHHCRSRNYDVKCSNVAVCGISLELPRLSKITGGFLSRILSGIYFWQGISFISCIEITMSWHTNIGIQ